MGLSLVALILYLVVLIKELRIVRVCLHQVVLVLINHEIGMAMLRVLLRPGCADRTSNLLTELGQHILALRVD